MNDEGSDMRLRGSAIEKFAATLRHLDTGAILAHALADSADRLTQRIADEHPDAPPFATSTDDARALIRSTEPEAVLRERGDVDHPPRPFLAPIATSCGAAIAHDIAQAFTSALSARDHQT